MAQEMGTNWGKTTLEQKIRFPNIKIVRFSEF